MGLDQYLYVRRKIALEDAEIVIKAAGTSIKEIASDEEGDFYLPNYEHCSPDERARALRVVESAWMMSFLVNESKSIHLRVLGGEVFVDVQVAYWRKANSIHRWFVEEIQDGVDQCQESRPISVEELSGLCSLCEKALAAYRSGDKELAAKMVSPMSGFFFGSTAVDEYWAEDMQTTIDQIGPLIAKMADCSDVVAFYRASW